MEQRFKNNSTDRGMKSIESFEKKGSKILQSNGFFQDLCSLMKNNEFRQFYTTYFNDWSEIQCMIFYMKLYSTIQYEYSKRYNEEITDTLMTYMLHKIMTTSETRKYAFDLFQNYKDIDHKQTQEFRNLLTF